MLDDMHDLFLCISLIVILGLERSH